MSAPGTPRRPFVPRDARGASMVEVMIALVVLAIGVLGVSRMFPTGARSQLTERMTSTASYYAQEKIEQLSNVTWSSDELALGRHPAGTDVEALGTSGAWRRFYDVEAMGAPLDNLRRVTVTVGFTPPASDPRQVQAVTYVRR